MEYSYSQEREEALLKHNRAILQQSIDDLYKDTFPINNCLSTEIHHSENDSNKTIYKKDRYELILNLFEIESAYTEATKVIKNDQKQFDTLNKNIVNNYKEIIIDKILQQLEKDNLEKFDIDNLQLKDSIEICSDNYIIVTNKDNEQRLKELTQNKIEIIVTNTTDSFLLNKQSVTIYKSPTKVITGRDTTKGFDNMLYVDYQFVPIIIKLFKNYRI